MGEPKRPSLARAHGCALGALLLALCAVLPAQVSPRFDPLADGLLLGGSALFGIGSEFLDFKGEQHYEGTLLEPATVNGFDRPLMRAYGSFADSFSDLTLAIGIGTPLLLALGRTGAEDLALGAWYLEALGLANGSKNLIKELVDRRRPYAYFGNRPVEGYQDGDVLRSFPSGHATTAFAAAGFLGASFSRLYPDSPWKIPVWILSLYWAGTTAWLRMEGGMHFLSDVLAGAALGSLCGILIPELRFSMEDARAEADQTPASLAFPVIQLAFSY